MPKLRSLMSLVSEAGWASKQLLFGRRRHRVNSTVDFEVPRRAEHFSALRAGMSGFVVGGIVNSANVILEAGFVQKQAADVAWHLGGSLGLGKGEVGKRLVSTYDR